MLKGSMPALVTPFKNGAVDFDALKQLVEWHISEGTHGLVPVGTTGESPTLTHQEHEDVIRTVVETAAGRIPVIAGAGSNSTAEALHMVEFAKEVGADAALVVTPYYNKPTERGLTAHYEALAAVGLPIVIYNIPGRSVIDLMPEAMGQLAKHPNIIGVKDATGDLNRQNLQRMTCGTEFLQITGEDPTALAHAVQGGVGCISVTANAAPGLCAQFQEALMAKDYDLALQYQDRLMPLHCAIFMEPGTVGAKYAMSKLGKGTEEVRLPQVTASDATKTAIDAALVHAGLLN